MLKCPCAILGIACVSVFQSCSNSPSSLPSARSQTVFHHSAPPWGYDGPYNVQPSEVSGEETWITQPNLPVLTEDEFAEARQLVCEVARELGFARDEWVQNKDLFVWDDNYFDRTIRVEYSRATGTHNHFAALIRAVRAKLKSRPQWRVLFSAISEGSAIWVYPASVRTAFDTTPGTEEERIKRAATSSPPAD